MMPQIVFVIFSFSQRAVGGGRVGEKEMREGRANLFLLSAPLFEV